MPTYSYKCGECGHAFDVHQSFDDDALTTCPECGGPLRKVFGTVGVTFKGSGFYRTDSRGGASQPASSSNDGASASTGSEAKPTSTTKSAEKTGTKPAPTSAA